MRFDFYQTITKSGHIGYKYKTKQFLGVVTKNTFSGYHEKIAYCRKGEHISMIYGLYFLSILFLYGGHLHIVNSKKEYRGFLNFFFRHSQFKKTTKILKKKTPLFFSKSFPEFFIKFYTSSIYKKKKRISCSLEKFEGKNTFFEVQDLERRYPLSSFQFKGFAKKRSIRCIQNVLKSRYKEKFLSRTYSSRPFITYSETSIGRDSLSNWNHSLRFAKQYALLQTQFHHLFQWNRKMLQEYKELGEKSIGFFEVFSRNLRVVSKKPDVIILCNAENNYGLLYENFQQSIPLFGTVDTSTRREWFDFFWPGNTESSGIFYKWNLWIFQLYRYIRVGRFRPIQWYWKKESFKKQK